RPALPSFPTRRSSDLDNTVTFSKLGGFDWGTLSIEWSREDGVDHGAHHFNDGDTVSTKPSGFPLYYEITEGEMEQGVSGEVEARSEEHTSELQSRFDL